MSTETTKQPLTLERLEQLKTTYLTTLQNDPFKNSAKMYVANYEDLLWKMESLISVCQSSLMLLGENRNTKLNDWEHREVYKTCPIEVMNVLQIVKDMLPIKEASLLDELNNTN